MNSSLQIGSTTSITFTVTEKMLPIFSSDILHPVCSTWDMAHQFEIVARNILEPHLDDDEEGIGSHVSVNHVKPVPAGATVTLLATVTELDTSTVVCEITAKTKNLICATGKQIQKVLPKVTIDSIIARAVSHEQSIG